MYYYTGTTINVHDLPGFYLLCRSGDLTGATKKIQQRNIHEGLAMLPILGGPQPGIPRTENFHHPPPESLSLIAASLGMHSP